MKRSTKILTSVALTVGLVGGASAIGKNHHGSHEKRAGYMVAHIADELGLDATQTQTLEVLKDQILSARQTAKQDPVRDQALALVNAETFDRAQALELITNKTALMNQQSPDLVNALGDFLDSLNTEQKAEITDRLKKLQERKRRHRH